MLSSDQAALPIFRFGILILYSHLIKRIVFRTNEDLAGSDNALSALPQLSALDTLRFEQDKATELFGSLTEASADINSYRARMLAFVAMKIKTLDLYGFRISEAEALVRRFASLRTLGLAKFRMDYPIQPEGIDGFWGAIASARQLSNLAIETAGDFDIEWLANAFTKPLEHRSTSRS